MYLLAHYMTEKQLEDTLNSAISLSHSDVEYFLVSRKKINDPQPDCKYRRKEMKHTKKSFDCSESVHAKIYAR